MRELRSVRKQINMEVGVENGSTEVTIGSRREVTKAFVNMLGHTSGLGSFWKSGAEKLFTLDR